MLLNLLTPITIIAIYIIDRRRSAYVLKVLAHDMVVFAKSLDRTNDLLLALVKAHNSEENINALRDIMENTRKTNSLLRIMGGITITDI